MTQELIVPVDDLSTVLLPEDHELAPCDASKMAPGCTRAARWSWMCPGCKHLILLCTKHRDAVEAWANGYSGMQCGMCLDVVPFPLIWLPL